MEAISLPNDVNYLYLGTTLPKHAQIAFVFGSANIEPANIAASLHRMGIVKYVLLTGGVNRITKMEEALRYLNILVDAKVPRERIFVEAQSTNTRENVLFARTILEVQLGLENIGQIVVVTHWSHMRRAIMTLKAYMPDGIYYYPCSYIPISGSSPYISNEVTLLKVQDELSRIDKYLKLGHLVELETYGDAYV